MVVLRVLVPLTVLALSACWAPFFDEGLSASLALEAKMGRPVLSFEKKGVDTQNMESFRFRAFYEKNPTGGFLVFQSGFGHPAYRILSIVAHPWQAIGITPVPPGTWALDHQYPALFSLPPVSGVSKIAFTLGMGTQFLVFRQDGTPDTPPNLDVSSGIFPSRAIGINYFRIGATLDGFAGIIWGSPPFSFHTEDGTNLTGSTFSGPPASVQSFPPDLSLGTNGTFFRSPVGGVFILSTKQGDGTHVTVAHSAASPHSLVRRFGFSGRVEGLVNNSSLMLVRSGRNYEVYDLNGNLQTRFLAGDLVFNHDRWDSTSSRWYAVFSRVLARWNEGRTDIRVDVFEWPSDRLGDLGR